MSLANTLKRFYHVVLRRDVLGPLGISKFGSVGAGAIIYRPEVLDRNTKNVYVGSGTTIFTGSRIQLYSAEGEMPKIVIGEKCYIGYHNTFLAAADIVIGNEVLMASNILISSENHSTNPESDTPYMDQPLKASPVQIGDGTWLGERVMVMSGVSIGKKCVIGGGSVVTRDIPDYCVAVGSPARVVKACDFDKHEWVAVAR